MKIRLTELLKREDGLEYRLYFYRMGGCWCAFERSAYLAEIMFGRSAVVSAMYEWEEDGLVVKLPCVRVDDDLLASMDLDIQSAEEVNFPFQILPNKLRYWKSRMRQKHANCVTMEQLAL